MRWPVRKRVDLIAAIRDITLGPDDTLVVKINKDITQAQAESIKDAVARQIPPDARLLIAGKDVSFHILREGH